MSASLRRRVERLEAANGVGEVTFEEIIMWSRRDDCQGPEWDDFLRRCEASSFCRLVRETLEKGKKGK